MNEIEFTLEEIRAVWAATFGAQPPDELTVRKMFEACLSELGPEILRAELQERRYE
jgi:hypothetical protein